MEDIFLKINKEADWNSKISTLWSELEDGKEVLTPDNSNEASHYRERLRYLMEHNQEKYRDKEGREFYQKLENYITLLESKI